MGVSTSFVCICVCFCLCTVCVTSHMFLLTANTLTSQNQCCPGYSRVLHNMKHRRQVFEHCAQCHFFKTDKYILWTQIGSCLSIISIVVWLTSMTNVHVAQLSQRWQRKPGVSLMVFLRSTCTPLTPPILTHLWFRAVKDFHSSPAWWRRVQCKTFALPVVLSADTSHQSLLLALLDDELEWGAYLSRLGFNEVSAPPPLMGNYLVHQEFGSCPNHTAQGLI